MQSNEQKKLTGKYRADRDKTKGLPIPGDAVTEIQPPEKISPTVRAIWDMIIPPICHLQIIRQQDIPDLYLAFDMLMEIEKIDGMRAKLDNKCLLKDHLSEWLSLGERKTKLVDKYRNIMKDYFVSPKERLKSIALIAESINNLSQAQAPRDSLTAFIMGQDMIEDNHE